MSANREVRDDQHGTLTGYEYGCRCVECRATVRAYAREYRAANRDHLNALNRASLARRRDEKRSDLYSENASRDEVRQWAAALGLYCPPNMKGRNADALISRYNREHPYRTYLRPSERDGGAA